MNFKGLVKAVLFISSFAFATSTLASVNYAGTDCKEEFGTGIDLDWDGSAYNTGTGSLYIVCHVPHSDFDGFLHNGAIEGGFFTAIDENASDNMNCRFRSIWQTGSTINGVWAASSSTTGHGNHIQKVGLAGTDQENSDSVYILSCRIPGTDAVSARRSALRGYRVDQ